MLSSQQLCKISFSLLSQRLKVQIPAQIPAKKNTVLEQNSYSFQASNLCRGIIEASPSAKNTPVFCSLVFGNHDCWIGSSLLHWNLLKPPKHQWTRTSQALIPKTLQDGRETALISWIRLLRALSGLVLSISSISTTSVGNSWQYLTTFMVNFLFLYI